MTCAASMPQQSGQNPPGTLPNRVRFEKTADQRKATGLLAVYKWILLHGGSRSGKTLILVRAICLRALKASGSRHVIFRLRFNHIKQSIFMETLPELFEKDPELHKIKDRIKWNREDYFITFPNGSEVWIGGLDDKDRTEKVLGKEYATIYFNESSQIPYSSVTIAQTRLAQKIPGLVNKFYFDCNPPTKSHWLYFLFFLHEDPETRVKVNHPDLYAELLMNPEGNQENLPDDYIETILAALPERKRRRFKNGEWLDDVEGALWKRPWINNNRVQTAPDLLRIVVAIDPAVTSGEGSNATGITVQGIDTRIPLPHFYILADRSVEHASPMEWGQAAINAFHEFNADLMIGEVNNGGELVERNVKAIEPNIPFKMVHASRGKIMRAEPIANLYEQGRVHHVGEMPELEDEQCSYTPQMEADGKNSPNHLDACVWGVTALSGKIGGHVRFAARTMEKARS